MQLGVFKLPSPGGMPVAKNRFASTCPGTTVSFAREAGVWGNVVGGRVRHCAVR